MISRLGRMATLWAGLGQYGDLDKETHYIGRQLQRAQYIDTEATKGLSNDMLSWTGAFQ